MAKREAPLPLYYRVELQLREAIESGNYQAGDRLPTEKVLQEMFGVSRVTVRTALQRLEQEGMISTQRGRGTFVTLQGSEGQRIERHTSRLHSFEEDLRRQGGEATIRVVDVERVPAPQRIGALLDIEEGTELTRIRRVGWVDDAPLWMEFRYIRPTLDASLSSSDLGKVEISDVLASATGLRIDSSHLRITAASATKDQAATLDIRPGDPVLVNEFVDYAAGRPIEAARAVFRADRYAFSVEVAGPEAGAGQVRHSLLDAEGAWSMVPREVTA